MSSYTRDDFLALLIILEGKLSNRQIEMNDRRRAIMIDALNMALGHQLPVFSEEPTPAPVEKIDIRHLNFSERKLLREIQAAGSVTMSAAATRTVDPLTLRNEGLISIAYRHAGQFTLHITDRGRRAR